MAKEPSLGVVDHRCEVFGYEGLFCMDSSVIPTSLGVNPSLTIAAVCERAAASLVRRADDFGLPSAPEGLRHQAPGEHIGPRVHP
jgi:cholesterol oxidase